MHASDHIARPLGRAIMLLSLGQIAIALVLAYLNGYTPAQMSHVPFVAACGLVGGLIVIRRPGNRVGWLMTIGAFCFALLDTTGHYALYGLITDPGSLPGATIVAAPQFWLWVPGSVLLLILLPLYFPNGQLVSPGWRWLERGVVAYAVVMTLISAFWPGDFFVQVPSQGAVINNPLGIRLLRDLAPGSPMPGISFVVIGLTFGLICLAALSLVVRLLRSRGVERQQMKWLTFVVALAPLQIGLSWIFPTIGYLDVIHMASIPAAVAIAILRYNLYDIDRLINRTLVYGGVSATLGAVYVATILFFQTLVEPLVPTSGLSVAISTLAVAALFQPVRRRVQRWVDQQFYRERYDAARTVESFSLHARNEVNLENLTRELLTVVNTTLQPTHATLWLRAQRSSTTPER